MSPELDNFLNIVIKVFITAAVPILTVMVIGWLNAAKDQLKVSLSAEQFAQLEAVTEVLVQAAQQSGLAGKMSNDGAVKKAWVVEQLKQYASDNGLVGLDVAGFSALIEAKVYEVIKKPVVPVVSVPADSLAATVVTNAPGDLRGSGSASGTRATLR